MTPEPVNPDYERARVLSTLAANRPASIFPLAAEDAAEVFSFLEQRPVHTVVMAGLMRDNGVVSELNRGKFYGCRNTAGTIEGVALIGHTILFEARTDEALKSFAQAAQEFRRGHVIVGEQEPIARFWNHYSAAGQPMRHSGREVLFELSELPPRTEVANLRIAAGDDLALVMPVHAAMAFAESGVDPMKVDPEGFRARCRRRIEQGRVWVRVDQGQLIFKADVISETPAAIYLEGIYVHPGHRGKGIGSQCMAQLTRRLRRRTKTITALVNLERRQAQNFFRKLGFVSRGLYDTIFLMPASLP